MNKLFVLSLLILSKVNCFGADEPKKSAEKVESKKNEVQEKHPLADFLKPDGLKEYPLQYLRSISRESEAGRTAENNILRFYLKRGTDFNNLALALEKCWRPKEN